MHIPKGVDLIIWKDEPEVILRSQYNPDLREEDTYKGFYKGDICKVQPKGWHKYFDLSPSCFVLHVKNLRYNNEYKFTLTTTCNDFDGNAIIKRRYAVDLNKLKKIRPFVKVRSLDGLIIDKEN